MAPKHRDGAVVASGYPIEWFPSVSATIGDRYPERSVFQVFIAITSGPRFLLVGLWYILTARPGATLPKFVAGVGIFRTLTCGGWTYVTSTDDHDWHDIFMISYLVATLPWTIGCYMLSPPNPRTLYWRTRFGGAFFATLVPLVYFFIQHKVHRVPGAYTIYAFFEWSLVLLDVAFDAVTALDFAGLELVVKDVKGTSRGSNKTVSDAIVEKEKDKPVGEVFSTAFSRDGLLDAAADVYTGYIFWTILTSLGALVWYFPLWHMGISGYEVMVMSTVSPFLLGIGPLRRLIIANIRYVHLLSLSGVLAYLVVRPDYRLFAVGFGVWTSCLAWTATFYAERSQPAKLEGRIAAFGLGLVLSTISKFAFQTNNPVWPIVHGENGGWNKTGILLAILAMWRTSRTRLGNPDAVSGSKTPSGSSVLAGFGLAGLFFGMHSLLSDSSTMILWVWEGYPVRGPLAVPHGAVTIAAMSFGLLIGLYYPGMAGSWTFYGIGATGAAVLTGFSHWTGYYGGLALATYLMAVSPVLIKSAVLHPPGRTFFLGFFLYNFLVLAHVWVVAYAFVPGGPVMREHTDWVMTATMLFIGAGVFSATASNGSRAKSPPPNPAARKLRSYFVYVLLGLQLLSASVAYLRFPLYDYTPYHGPEKSITAGIWTIHFSLDNEMWTSERRMESLIREMELDVVGLLESDLQRIIMGNRDTTQYLAEELGMWVDYGPGPNKHTWGCALLSKFPIVNSTHHLLPSPVGELAPAIHATVDAYGTLVDVFVFHSGQEEDPEDRRLQSLYLSDLMKNSPRPSILLSYLVTKPKEGNYNTYVGEMSGMKDIDSSDWDRWCEYILYKGLRRTGYARVSRGTITDTELQVGKFVVGQPEGSDEIISEDQVPQGLRFPALFKGDGVRGHRYHVFDEPRYYA
ncbi:Protein cwh43 [Zalaria obscura]|uniref:Protein cwh43 n=1 Tax=Zalaria obscura TaxID=2024903 RepID=A0ACC3SP89_9PEZI